MDLGLKGKRALVTGGTRGIGRAIVDALAGEGADVAFCARDAAAVEQTVAGLGQSGVRVSGAALDVTDGEGLPAWIDGVAAEFGGIDIVVANVSALSGTPGEEGWRRGFEVDVLATVRTVDAALPHLEKSEAGSIVAIASTAALESFGGVRAYNSVKAAVINYVSSLASALAPQGIRANTVSPGSIFFEGGVWDTRKREQPEIFEAVLARNPMGRMGTPEEVARAVSCLAGPSASFITGANLVVDGGLTQRVQY